MHHTCGYSLPRCCSKSHRRCLNLHLKRRKIAVKRRATDDRGANSILQVRFHVSIATLVKWIVDKAGVLLYKHPSYSNTVGAIIKTIHTICVLMKKRCWHNITTHLLNFILMSRQFLKTIDLLTRCKCSIMWNQSITCTVIARLDNILALAHVFGFVSLSLVDRDGLNLNGFLDSLPIFSRLQPILLLFCKCWALVQLRLCIGTLRL